MHRLHCEHLQYDIDQFLASVVDKVVDKKEIVREMVEKWSITVGLADKLADKEEFTTEQVVTALSYTGTSAKRYLRQLTDFGYLQQHGGNRNRSYTKA